MQILLGRRPVISEAWNRTRWKLVLRVCRPESSEARNRKRWKQKTPFMLGMARFIFALERDISMGSQVLTGTFLPSVGAGYLDGDRTRY